jgi:hypothetical protein
VRLIIRSNLPGAGEVFSAEIKKLDNYGRTPARGKPSLWDRFAVSWRSNRKRMFETAGAYVGTPWLSYDQTAERDWYKYYKAIVYNNDRPLTLFDVLRWRGSDILMRSFTEKTSPHYFEERSPLMLALGSSLRYADNHNRGVGVAPSRLGGHPIPWRPLTALGGRLGVAWREDLIDYATDWGVQLGEKLDRNAARLLPLA